MKELQNKYNELETQRCNLIETEANLKHEIWLLSQQNKDTNEAEEGYYATKRMIKEIYEKQRILEKAMIIMEGGEIEW